MLLSEVTKPFRRAKTPQHEVPRHARYDRVPAAYRDLNLQKHVRKWDDSGRASAESGPREVLQ